MSQSCPSVCLLSSSISVSQDLLIQKTQEMEREHSTSKRLVYNHINVSVWLVFILLKEIPIVAK